MNEEKVINLSNSNIDYVETSKLLENRIINDKKEMNVIIRNNFSILHLYTKHHNIQEHLYMHQKYPLPSFQPLLNG